MVQSKLGFSDRMFHGWPNFGPRLFRGSFDCKLFWTQRQSSEQRFSRVSHVLAGGLFFLLTQETSTSAQSVPSPQSQTAGAGDLSFGSWRHVDSDDFSRNNTTESESDSLNSLNAQFGFPALPSDCEWEIRSPPLKSKRPEQSTLWHRVMDDHRNYYGMKSLRMLAGGFLAGAAIANTQLDHEIQDHFQSSVRGATSDEWFEFLHANKELGNGIYTLPVFAGAWALGEYFHDSPPLAVSSEWGERSLRSFLVGAPPLILAQKLTGGSRPIEDGVDSSHWSPWADNNGVSGHAFMSSLPFINAAKMTENRWLKTTYYAGSLLGPLSRVNDDAHYPSQVALGWWMAFVAASAVDRTQFADGRLQLYPMATSDGYGALFEFTY